MKRSALFAAILLGIGLLLNPLATRGRVAMPNRSLDTAQGPAPAPLPEWTAMVFMDGDNNLEEDALHDFEEMAEVGSTDKVNIVVLFDRIGTYTVNSLDKAGDIYENWGETLRFHITKGMKPTRANAIKDATCQVSPGRPEVCPELNMGDPNVLRDFIAWGKRQYPAQRYILIIWDHGTGWRRVIPNTATNRAAFGPAPAPAGASQQPTKQVRRGDMVMADTFRAALGSPYRAASHDETSDDQLYNSEIQQGLQDGLGGQKLQILGFDACLMAMVETAYAMRDQAAVLVGSEDLEPGSGWQYNDWLQQLVARPSMNEVELGNVLVESYKKQYDPVRKTTTQSAVRLTQADALAKAVSALADSMRAKMTSEAQNIKAARDECAMFAPNPFEETPPKDYFFHIDFIRFCDLLLAHAKDQDVKNKAQAARDLAAASVIATYAGSERKDRFGSHGLAIYFPASGSFYKNDQYAQGGYEKSNTVFPVAFVRDHTWSDFLHAYFKQFP